MPEINNFKLMNLYVYNYKIKDTNKYLNILIPTKFLANERKLVGKRC